MAKILLVEDDKTIGKLVSLQLERDHHLVERVDTGKDALFNLKVHDYDLVILDWMLPDLSGLDVCKSYRDAGGKVPILMLTARGEAQDKANALDTGADDYLVKPFVPVELSARIRALLRRPSVIAGKSLSVGDIVLDSANREVTRSGASIDLTAKEFALLELLMRHPNQSFSVEAILDRLWKSEVSASLETVRTHVKTLRRKLGDSEENPIIRTKRGLGYRIVSED
ncbi:MAG: response regulator transcription factor [Candidatus Obscuribacterales bacterium]|nr:response regulator transcription factor [Candidatus Obscuribacterales bacterium]